ncbi:hypothetical protein BJ742DRAFT_788012 [Cladochytrium replicatum]|nr:hypothetical protein BJ742DRAFT_788012 [Cladochytrium replicatum]
MPDINVTVKCSNDTRLLVQFDPESTTVLQLKEKLENQLDQSGQPTPANQQRLIYSGRVLKDDAALSTYKVAEGHTIHLVRQTPKPAASSSPANAAASAAPTSPSAAAPAATEARSAPSVTPSTPASGATAAAGALGFGDPSVDPLAAILGGGAGAGAGGLPFGSGAGGGFPFGGLGGGLGGGFGDAMTNVDPQRMNELMSNPAVLQGMSQLFSNPAIMDAILQSNPQLSSMMTPEMRQMMQSEDFRRMMANPEVIRSAMTLGPMLSQMGMGPGGAPSPFANPWAPAATPATGAPTSPTATPGQANPAANMFNPALLGMLLGGGAQGALPGRLGGGADLGGRNPEEVFEVQLRQLQEMGFYDAAENVRVLTMTGGNVEAALEYLFSNPRR